jgi:uncharacterized protein (DUF2267 family)
MSENNQETGVVDIVNKINDSDRASAIDAIHDLLFARASDAMAQYKQIVADTFFDEPTEEPTKETTDETDNGTD